MRTGIILTMTALGAVALSGCGATRSMFSERSELIATPSPCGERRFDVYFDEGQARLTQPARQMISLTASDLNACRIERVRVIGLADATGTPEANLTLSQRRAQTVAQAFAASGWPTPAFELGAAGDQGADVGGGVQEPLRRRTEVVVHAAPL